MVRLQLTVAAGLQPVGWQESPRLQLLSSDERRVGSAPVLAWLWGGLVEFRIHGKGTAIMAVRGARLRKREKAESNQTSPELGPPGGWHQHVL